MVVSSYRLHYQATAIGRSSNQWILRRNHGSNWSIYQVWTVHTVPRDLESNGFSTRFRKRSRGKS
jgi:hypothetical protein